MSNRGWMIAGGAGGALLLWLILPNWLAILLVLGVIGVPVAGYLLLDPAQRRRITRVRNRRKEIGR